jgi:hypothetical protein
MFPLVWQSTEAQVHMATKVQLALRQRHSPLSKSVKLLHSRLPQDDFHATKCTWPAGRCPSPAYLLTVIFFYRIENIVSIPSFASKLYLCTSDIRMFSDGLISVETLTKQTLQRPSHFVRACQSSAIICSE